MYIPCIKLFFFVFENVTHGAYMVIPYINP